MRRHWGARLGEAGEARFRLWAPAQEALTLRLGDRDLAMPQIGDGWFELVADAQADTQYGFVLPDGAFVPDPASCAQAGDVHGPSVLVDHQAYSWRNRNWRGRPWREAVLYELHVGTFTPEGTFAAAIERLPHLAQLGVTAIELMPIAQFSGNRGWGYDGVLLYAPHRAYGSPEELKRLVDQAHGLGLMVKLDVVYNHFGPEGNYLPSYAPDFFHKERHTPWGNAIAYERLPVRQYFTENALYWLDEFRFDGLRLDAADHIRDATEPEILIEIAERVRAEFPDRHVHLATEDNRNVTYLHERVDGMVRRHTAEWNDDLHNAAHVVLTDETEGYYEDFADKPLAHVARALAEGFAYQGEASRFDNGTPRGKPSGHMPATVFIDFLQNHDQIGNRAFGDRLTTLADPEKLRAMTAVLLLSPHIPLLFMGEEWGETRPFMFFTDYQGELADAVRKGRRAEFAKFEAFADREDRAAIPDPNELATFENSKLDWNAAQAEPGMEWTRFYRQLLAIRHEHVVPLLDDAKGPNGRVLMADENAFAIDWQFDGGKLQMRANLGNAPRSLAGVDGTVVYGPASAVDLQPASVVVAVAQ